MPSYIEIEDLDEFAELLVLAEDSDIDGAGIDEDKKELINRLRLQMKTLGWKPDLYALQITNNRQDWIHRYAGVPLSNLDGHIGWYLVHEMHTNGEWWIYGRHEFPKKFIFDNGMTTSRKAYWFAVKKREMSREEPVKAVKITRQNLDFYMNEYPNVVWLPAIFSTPYLLLDKDDIAEQHLICAKDFQAQYDVVSLNLDATINIKRR